MRLFFLPADAPIWLRLVVYSIRDGLSDVWNTAIRLKDYTTVNLPPAADWKQGLVYDSTLNSPHYSNGTSWVRLSDYDADVAAIAALSTTGLIARTGAGTAATRTITGPAAGITVTNGDGVAGNPTLGLANDLAALEGLGSTGIAARTAADTWAQRTVTGTANQITVTNGDGVAANPTLSLPSPMTTPGNLTVTGDMAATGKISQAGAAGAANAIKTNSGNLASTTDINPGLVVYYDGSSYYGLDLGYNSSFRTRLSAPNTIAIAISGTSPTAQSHFTEVATFTGSVFNLLNGLVLQIGGTQVIAARKTGWATATGTATRTTFDTATVTTAQLAERVKALIDDLHGTAGHGLIGT